MPRAVWEKVKTEAEKFNDVLDDKADEQLQKVKESRYTGLILGGVALIAIALIVLLAAY
ncbi:hypothetical protein SAMN05216420_101414 [Nitrosospira sp. Nl5]|uniref:hypothetical protein n=1 Tax=Nitrosospira sp. Nl5 TaxID=200120 RepID=UPI00088C9D7A|nr:hypothetical protein [Nitrosospira sp. Nl5]SCX94659.1 hypothetical protein SAMN05216420_101414 [Nitrosospira sp. Nl5]